MSTVIVAIGMILAIAACVYLFVQYAEGKSPSLLGYKFYYILTDSMEPELRVNDVIISKTINSAQEAKMKVKEGDVVTYIAAEGAQKGMTITHKVIKEPHIDQRTGKEVILTKGVEARRSRGRPRAFGECAGRNGKKGGFLELYIPYAYIGLGNDIACRIAFGDYAGHTCVPLDFSNKDAAEQVRARQEQAFSRRDSQKSGGRV